MAETINNKSFADSVNLIADLDSTYSKSVYILKNNIQLNSQTYVATANIVVFNVSNISLETIPIVSRNVVGNLELESFMSDIKTSIELLIDSVDMTYSVSQNGNDYSIRVDVISSDILIRDFNIKFAINNITKYDLHSGSDSYIKILPFLSSIGAEAISGMKNIAPVASELKAIGPAIQYLSTIANNISGINTVSANISNVNAVAPNASYLPIVAPFVNDIKTLSENVNVIRDLNGNVDNLVTLAGSIDAVVVLSNRLVEIGTVNENIAEIVAVANSIYPNIIEILKSKQYSEEALASRDEAESFRDSAAYYNHSARRFAYGTGEIETGLYSAKHYAQEAQNASMDPSSLLTKIKTVDGRESGLDADMLDGFHGYMNGPKSMTVPIRDGGGGISANLVRINGVSFESHTPLEVHGDAESAIQYDHETMYLYDAESLNPGGYIRMPKYRLGYIFGPKKDIDAFNDVYKRIVNTSGITVNGLSAVEYISSDGASTTVKAAFADSSIQKRLYGVSISSMLSNRIGLACRSGHIRSVNTTGSQFSEVWNDGDKIYLKPGTVSGALTNIEPDVSSVKIFIGIVIRSHATDGILDVTITNINENDFINAAALVTASSINAYNKTEVDNKLSVFGTIADFEGALL